MLNRPSFKNPQISESNMEPYHARIGMTDVETMPLSDRGGYDVVIITGTPQTTPGSIRKLTQREQTGDKPASAARLVYNDSIRQSDLSNTTNQPSSTTLSTLPTCAPRLNSLSSFGSSSTSTSSSHSTSPSSSSYSPLDPRNVQCFSTTSRSPIFRIPASQGIAFMSGERGHGHVAYSRHEAGLLEENQVKVRLTPKQLKHLSEEGVRFGLASSNNSSPSLTQTSQPGLCLCIPNRDAFWLVQRKPSSLSTPSSSFSSSSSSSSATMPSPPASHTSPALPRFPAYSPSTPVANVTVMGSRMNPTHLRDSQNLFPLPLSIPNPPSLTTTSARATGVSKPFQPTDSKTLGSTTTQSKRPSPPHFRARTSTLDSNIQAQELSQLFQRYPFLQPQTVRLGISDNSYTTSSITEVATFNQSLSRSLSPLLLLNLVSLHATCASTTTTSFGKSFVVHLSLRLSPSLASYLFPEADPSLWPPTLRQLGLIPYDIPYHSTPLPSGSPTPSSSSLSLSSNSSGIPLASSLDIHGKRYLRRLLVSLLLDLKIPPHSTGEEGWALYHEMISSVSNSTTIKTNASPPASSSSSTSNPLLPLDPIPSGFRSSLLPFQRQGLHWIALREMGEPTSPTLPSPTILLSDTPNPTSTTDTTSTKTSNTHSNSHDYWLPESGLTDRFPSHYLSSLCFVYLWYSHGVYVRFFIDPIEKEASLVPILVKRMRGGILADWMGLGKTVQMLAGMTRSVPFAYALRVSASLPENQVTDLFAKTITDHIPPHATLITPTPDPPSTSSTSSTPSSSSSPSDAPTGAITSRVDQATMIPTFTRHAQFVSLLDLYRYGRMTNTLTSLTGSTLVVCPVSLIEQWQREVQRHTNLTPLIVHSSQKGGNEEIDSTFLTPSTVVITSYTMLVKHWKLREEALKNTTQQGKMTNKGPSSKSDGKQVGWLYTYTWYRVVLDEAHVIRNRYTDAARAVYQIPTLIRWALTGTPIQNSPDDLFSLFHYLKHAPWCDSTHWNRLVSYPLARNDSQYLTRIRMALAPVLLRRTKNDQGPDGNTLLNLPPCVDVLERVAMSSLEKEMYTTIYSAAKKEYHRLVRENRRDQLFFQVFTLLLRLRQAACHPHMALLAVQHSQMLTNDAIGALGVRFLDEEYSREMEKRTHSYTDYVVQAPAKASIHLQAGDQHERTHDSEQAIGLVTTMDGGGVDRNQDSSSLTNTEEKDEWHHEGVATMRDSGEEYLQGGRDMAEETMWDDSLDAQEQSDRGIGGIGDKIERKDELSGSSEHHGDDGNSGDLTTPCAICDQALSQPVKIISCGHILCLECATERIEEHSGHSPCPQCQTAFSLADLIPAEQASAQVPSKGERHHDGVSALASTHQQTVSESSSSLALLFPKLATIHSTKSARTIQILRLLKQKDSNLKAVIFSQWLPMLKLMKYLCEQERFQSFLFDGSMTIQERDAAVQGFTNATRPSVMIISLKAGGVGINLISASAVILMDSWWNPAVIEQAIERVHRIGQTKPVSVFRLISRETVEEHMLSVSTRKAQTVMSVGMGEAKLEISDLTSVFSSM